MGRRSNIFVWLLWASTAAVGCGAESVALEDPSVMGLEGALEAGGCTLVEMLGGASGSIEVGGPPRAGRMPRFTSSWFDGRDDFEGVSGGWDLLVPGEHKVSVELRGRAALSKTIRVPADRQTVALLYAHSAHEARLSPLQEVDLSPADRGLRRVRITNYVQVVEPIQLFFYDEHDEPVGESESIAWGETWTATISSAAIGYRLSPEQRPTHPFADRFPFKIDHPEPVDLPCVDALPLGLVVVFHAAAPVPDGDEWQLSHITEHYTYLPPVCDSN